MSTIIYIFDGLEAVHLSCYEHGKNSSSNINNSVKERIIFKGALPQSICTFLAGVLTLKEVSNEVF